MSKKVLLVFFISIACTEIASWTIDLPEARKYFFEKAEKDKVNNNNENSNRDDLFFDNIVPDSPHNKDELDYNIEHQSNDSENDVYGGRYAEGYEYLSYMEKKVHGIAHNGSVYLEGLRRALEDYGELLQKCARFNFTQTRSPHGPWLPENERPLPPNPQNPSITFPSPQNTLNSDQNAFNLGQIALNSRPNSVNPSPNPPNETSVDLETCERATRASEHVRRLAQLALWATRELQDRAYADKYDKGYPRSDDEEEAEAELLLRLAFFLDRLASLTGYEPEPKDYITPSPPRSTTPSTSPASVMGEVPDDVKMMMITCLQSNSSEPATERCKYPLQYPQFLRKMLNITESPGSVQPLTTESSAPRTFNNPIFAFNQRQKRDNVQNNPEILTDDLSKQNILISDYRDSLTAVRQKRDTLTAGDRDTLTVKRQKRSIDLGDLVRSIGNSLIPITSIFADTLKPMAQELGNILGKNTQGNFLPKNGGETVKRETLTADSQFQDILTEGGSLKSNDLTGVAQDTTIDSQIHNIVTSVNRQKRIKKRSIDDHPLKNVINYYIKHKIWANSNIEVDSSDFDVTNHLTAVKSETPVKVKRSVNSKKAQHLRLPENPFQDLSSYVKHRSGVNYVRNEKDSEKLRQYLEKIRHSDSLTAKSFMQKLSKSSPSHVKKRSIEYERKFLPSRSENPRQDISYYQKNKLGTEYQNNLAQAAQVRAALEKDFNTGNILIVQRYGSNYNPLVPNPIMLGIMQSFFTDL